jgi:hypothetical protein
MLQSKFIVRGQSHVSNIVMVHGFLKQSIEYPVRFDVANFRSLKLHIG